jgi:Uma2 family endonuclease
MTRIGSLARQAARRLPPAARRTLRRWHTRVRMRHDGLLAFAENRYSQNGEDGIHAAIFRRIGVVHRACCEVGASDGVWLSNTRCFVLEGWHAVLIEADSDRVPALVESCRLFPRTTCVPERITPTGRSSISALCRAAGVAELDLLSIDIDGDDADVFAGLEIRPRVICVETNTLVAPEERRRAYGPGHTGQSLGVMVEIGDALGYMLVAYTGPGAGDSSRARRTTPARVCRRTPLADSFRRLNGSAIAALLARCMPASPALRPRLPSGRMARPAPSELDEETIPVPRLVRFPVELRPPEGFDPDDLATWPRVEGRLEWVGGRLLWMPPCGDEQQDTVADVVVVLGLWARAHSEFVVGTNEAGLKIGSDRRGADAAVFRRADVGPYRKQFRAVPPILAVEVAGGVDEPESTLREKAQWYFDHGVAVVWVVLPDSREVVVLTRTGETRHGMGDVLPPSPHLPDLAARVDDLFRQLAGA